MADTAFTVWSAKRFYGSLPTEVTWRPVTAIQLADAGGNPDTIADPGWSPLIITPSHPEYPAGHPSLNGPKLLARKPIHTIVLTSDPNRAYFTFGCRCLPQTGNQLVISSMAYALARCPRGFVRPSNDDHALPTRNGSDDYRAHREFHREFPWRSTHPQASTTL
jgi:hypothetical protein